MSLESSVKNSLCCGFANISTSETKEEQQQRVWREAAKSLSQPIPIIWHRKIIPKGSYRYATNTQEEQQSWTDSAFCDQFCGETPPEVESSRRVPVKANLSMVEGPAMRITATEMVGVFGFEFEPEEDNGKGKNMSPHKDTIHGSGASKRILLQNVSAVSCGKGKSGVRVFRHCKDTENSNDDSSCQRTVLSQILPLWEKQEVAVDFDVRVDGPNTEHSLTRDQLVQNLRRLVEWDNHRRQQESSEK